MDIFVVILIIIYICIYFDTAVGEKPSGKGSLVLRHSILYFPLKFYDIACK